MKKLFKIFFVAITLTGALNAFGASFSQDGIYYTITNAKLKTVSVARSSYTYYTGDLVIPATVTYNGTEYIVTGLEYGAFYNCTDLTSVTLGANIETIEGAVFTGCAGLRSINVDALNTTYLSLDGVLYGNQGELLVKFPAAKVASYYVVPEGVTAINDFAFEYAFGVDNVSFPSTLKSIGMYAFQYSPIESVKLPAGMTSLGEYAFYSCPYITTIDTGGLTEIPSFAFNTCEAVTSLTLGDYVTSIGDFAFFQEKNLESVTLPEGLQTIGAGAFKSCESLRTVNIPSTVTSIGLTAFSFCRSMRSIKVAEGNSMYCDLGGVLCNKGADTIIEFPGGYPGEYEIPEGIVALGPQSFYYRTRLSEITLPQSLRSIHSSCFHGCNAIKEITIPDGVTLIGSQAFMFCDRLETVTIGENIKRIESNAFNMCDALSTINVRAPRPFLMIDDNIFSRSTYAKAQVNVPQGTKDAYASAPVWKLFANISDNLQNAVSGIETDDADAVVEIFNVSGVRIYTGLKSECPELPSGIYIERCGDKVTKVKH